MLEAGTIAAIKEIYQVVPVSFVHFQSKEEQRLYPLLEVLCIFQRISLPQRLFERARSLVTEVSKKRKIYEDISTPLPLETSEHPEYVMQ